jgi:hypothetical protein
MSHTSGQDLLALHGVRVMGMASPAAVAARYRLDVEAVAELLGDDEARGWVRKVEFAGTAGWTITERGRAENERQLAEELDGIDARDAVAEAHAAFRPLNRRFGTACTQWQIRPTPTDPMAFNDHTDWRWDERVLRELESLDSALRGICAQLVTALARFDGHADCYSFALSKVQRGERAWLDAPDRPSCHTVWIQLHEDLLATLGIPRGADS